MTETDFHVHPLRGPFNALFFWLTGGLFDRLLGSHKRRLLRDLPDTVVELGSGVGANLRYLAPGSRLIAVEPNPAMHGRLRRAAERRGVRLDVRPVPAERTELPDGSAEVVVSSLVLCTVGDVGGVLAEVRRVLRPGGRFVFVEHVAAPDGTALRRLQRWVRAPWAWLFEGCSCERDLGGALRAAGFASVELEAYRLRSPFLPFNPQIAGWRPPERASYRVTPATRVTAPRRIQHFSGAIPPGKCASRRFTGDRNVPHPTEPIPG